MKNIGRGMRIGHSMRPCSSIYFLGVAIYLIFCGHACSPADPSKLDCGLFLDIYTPKKADSIHVAIYRNDTLLYLLKDSIPCKECDRRVNLEKSCKDLYRETGQNYGRYYIDEKAFCGEQETLFKTISVTIDNGGPGSYINAHYIPEDSRDYSTFATQKNGCNIDSTYKIIVVDNASEFIVEDDASE